MLTKLQPICFKWMYFISVDGSAPGTPLTYGQPFAITSYDGSVRLHLFYEKKTLKINFFLFV